MEEKKEIKVKLSTIIYLTIIVALIVALGITYYFGFIATKKKNIEYEKIINVIENENINNESNNVDLYKNEYKSLNELALLKISSNNLTKKEEIYEYDFNKDGTKEKLTLKQTNEEINSYSFYYGTQKIVDSEFDFSIFIVDLDENDEYFDLIFHTISTGGFTNYSIYKNNGKTLNKLKYTTDKTITDDFEGNNFYLDKNNNFVLLGDVESSLDKFVTDTVYSINGKSINSTKIEIEKNKTYTYKVDKNLRFVTDYNKASIAYNNENLKLGTELQILDRIKGPIGYEITKVKLSSGEIGYIYVAYS